MFLKFTYDENAPELPSFLVEDVRERAEKIPLFLGGIEVMSNVVPWGGEWFFKCPFYVEGEYATDTVLVALDDINMSKETVNWLLELGGYSELIQNN